MTHLRESIRIAADSEPVWKALTDFDRMHTWFLGVRRVELLAEVPGAGAERILTLVWGASHRERIGVWEPGKRFSIVVLDPPFFVRSWTAMIGLEDAGAAVAVHWEMRWDPRFGRPGAAFDRWLLRPAIRTALRLSLRRLRDRLEGETGW